MLPESAAILTAIQPTAAQPTAAQPTAIQPTAAQPTAVQPTAVQPTAIQPTVVQPTAIQSAAAGSTASRGTASGAPQVVLAFDFGHRRIGVACGDTISRTAAPLVAVPAGVGGVRWEMIDALLREWQPALIVVGLPYNVDGSDSTMTSAAREFAAALERRCRLQVVLVDERYSSREAEARLKSARESGLRRRRVAKADVDATAACVILERWFAGEA
jgi:putative holliday junction resolvase